MSGNYFEADANYDELYAVLRGMKPGRYTSLGSTDMKTPFRDMESWFYKANNGFGMLSSWTFESKTLPSNFDVRKIIPPLQDINGNVRSRRVEQNRVFENRVFVLDQNGNPEFNLAAYKIIDTDGGFLMEFSFGIFDPMNPVGSMAPPNTRPCMNNEMFTYAAEGYVRALSNTVNILYGVLESERLLQQKDFTVPGISQRNKVRLILSDKSD